MTSGPRSRSFTRLAEPGDARPGALVRVHQPVEALEPIRSERLPLPPNTPRRAGVPRPEYRSSEGRVHRVPPGSGSPANSCAPSWRPSPKVILTGHLLHEGAPNADYECISELARPPSSKRAD
jgi:hypothetical protein